MLDLRERLQDERHRSAPAGGAARAQGRGHRALHGLRHLRPRRAGRLRLRRDRQRRHQHGLRTAALRHRAARGGDPAPLRPQAPAQDRLDPLRRLAAGDRGRPQLLLQRLLLLHSKTGHPDQGPRRGRAGHHLPQRHPLLRQGLRALLPARGEAAGGRVHPQLRLHRQGDPGDEERHDPLRHGRRGDQGAGVRSGGPGRGSGPAQERGGAVAAVRHRAQRARLLQDQPGSSRRDLPAGGLHQRGLCRADGHPRGGDDRQRGGRPGW